MSAICLFWQQTNCIAATSHINIFLCLSVCHCVCLVCITHLHGCVWLRVRSIIIIMILVSYQLCNKFRIHLHECNNNRIFSDESQFPSMMPCTSLLAFGHRPAFEMYLPVNYFRCTKRLQKPNGTAYCALATGWSCERDKHRIRNGQKKEEERTRSTIVSRFCSGCSDFNCMRAHKSQTLVRARTLTLNYSYRQTHRKSFSRPFGVPHSDAAN